MRPHARLRFVDLIAIDRGVIAFGMRSHSRALLLGSVLVAGAVAPAAAEDVTITPSSVADAKAPDTDQFNLPKGKLAIDAFLGIDLSKDLVGKPVSLSPDVWYGVTDDITVGLVHSTVGTTGFLVAGDTSLCLTGTDNGCAKVYNNVGLDLRYRLKTPLSLDAGLYFPSMSPFEAQIKVGLDGRWRFLPDRKLAVEVQPALFFGLNKRDDAAATGTTTVVLGNKDFLYIPVTGSYQVIDKLDVALQIGLATRLENIGDLYTVPISLAGRYAVNDKLSVGLALAFPRLIAKHGMNEGAIDARTLMLGGSYAL